MNDTNKPKPKSKPGLDLGEPQAESYRVLARKYRPATFEDLIGQDAVVRTISNAFETKRIPQAWILTGVRGVGKTTTARILARALNYELPDGSVTEPSITMPKLGLHCQAIMESRHIDVIEMDAASHNSVATSIGATISCGNRTSPSWGSSPRAAARCKIGRTIASTRAITSR